MRAIFAATRARSIGLSFAGRRVPIAKMHSQELCSRPPRYQRRARGRPSRQATSPHHEDEVATRNSDNALYSWSRVSDIIAMTGIVEQQPG